MTKNQKNSANSNQNPAAASLFKPPKPSQDTVKAKFNEYEDTKVSENIQSYQAGNDYGNLVALMSCMVRLGDMYELWIEGKSRRLAQVMA